VTRATGFGTNPAVTPETRLEIDRVMLPVNPPTLVRVIEVEFEPPTGTMRVVGFAMMVKSLTTRLADPELGE